MQKAEDFLAQVFYPVKKYVPAIARLLLVTTFLEDSIRLVFQWDVQVLHFERQGFGFIGAPLFLIINLVAQLVGSFMVVSKVRTEIGVAVLLIDLFTQAIAYKLFSSLAFVLRALSVCGGLLLLLADNLVTQNKSKSFFPGLPALDQETRTKYLQLAGRVLLVCLCLSLMVGTAGEFTFLRVLLILIGTVMCTMVILGFQAKMTAVILLVGVSIANVLLNGFWDRRTNRDVMQYDFFQTLSVLGGFILLALLGPGDLSMDERKKKY